MGEELTIAERLIVSPCWGRFRAAPLVEGQPVAAGTLIGVMVEQGVEIPLVSHVGATFLSWLAREGERLAPGSRIAALRLSD